MSVPTDATYFYMTDQRGTDRTPTAPAGSTSSTSGSWSYTR
jgi:hypothetical protein